MHRFTNKFHTNLRHKEKKMNTDIRPSKEDIMTHLEINDLNLNETIIQKGMQSFVAVGEALQDIRQRRLWRKTHDTFEHYLKDRWAMGAPYATRLIKGSEVAKRLPDILNEGQAREMGKVPYTDQEKVLERAKEFASDASRPLSANDIRIASLEPSKMTARPNSEDVMSTENKSPLWDDAEQLLADLRETTRRLVLNPEGCWIKPHIDTIEVRLKDVITIIKRCKPHCGCPVCYGGLHQECDT
jgi:hypothetical protein